MSKMETMNVESNEYETAGPERDVSAEARERARGAGDATVYSPAPGWGGSI